MSDGKNNTYTSFLGSGWSFPPTFSKGRGGVEMTSDEEDIRCSLEILLSTSVGERIMQPKYGCNLRDLLFDPLNTTMQTYITGLISDAILHFEPRVLLENVALGMDSVLEGRVDIYLDYRIRTTNSRYNMVYPFYLDESTMG